MSDEFEEDDFTDASFEIAAEPALTSSGATQTLQRRPSNRREFENGTEDPQLDALFLPDVAHDFRSRWDDVQRSFVDDPKQAVLQADKLVTQVMKNLTESFSRERARLEGESSPTDESSTESLRVALRSYRGFFERLLSL
ncbi:MAG: hypothetical protein ABSF50_03290 [Burkholderiaceae bacterium]|jgi:hypothetical protein